MTTLLSLYRSIKYRYLFAKRVFYLWELKGVYSGRLDLPRRPFFEDHFKIRLDDRTSKIQINDTSYFRDYCTLLAFENGIINIGSGVFFNNSCSINALGQINIGDNCMFGENVRIYDHNHRFREARLIKEQGFSVGRVQIGNNCWIGSNVTILKNTTIGDNSVISAGICLQGDIPPNSLVISDGNQIVVNPILR